MFEEGKEAAVQAVEWERENAEVNEGKRPGGLPLSSNHSGFIPSELGCIAYSYYHFLERSYQ